MKDFSYFISTMICLNLSYARLIERRTENKTITDVTPTKSTQPIRSTRQISEEYSLIGLSRELNGQTYEDYNNIKPTYDITARYSFKVSPSEKTRPLKKFKKSSNINSKNSSESYVLESKSKKALVKPPIPKLKEIDYDDFQIKVNKLPIRLVDSGEHKDEDFNLNDYDFDVNHDEYAVRGKPLEPRIKIKDAKEKKHKKSKPLTEPPPEIKMQSKVVIPRIDSRINDKAIKVADKIKEDYYDDYMTTTKFLEKEKSNDADDESDEENEDSKEALVRSAKSPWKINSYRNTIRDKATTIVSKILGILPMFP